MEQIREIILNGKSYKFTDRAYRMLISFLNRIKNDKNYSDIEIQISVLADMETESKESKIVDGNTVNEIIKVIKENRKIKFRQNFFEEEKFSKEKQKNAKRKKRNFLRRDKKGKIFSGVCSGIARFLGIDPVYVRVLFLAGALFRGVFIVVYIILWIIMPSNEENGYKKKTVSL